MVVKRKIWAYQLRTTKYMKHTAGIIVVLPLLCKVNIRKRFYQLEQFHRHNRTNTLIINSTFWYSFVCASCVLLRMFIYCKLYHTDSVFQCIYYLWWWFFAACDFACASIKGPVLCSCFLHYSSKHVINLYNKYCFS